jgi:hypothetical protein
MNSLDETFLELYHKHRYTDQQQFYKQRAEEFDVAHSQAVTVTGVLLVLTAAAAAAAGVSDGALKVACGILAVVFPVLSTAFTAYLRLYSFDGQAKLYHDAQKALMQARALQPGLGDADYPAALQAYVRQVEDVLRREQGQWGQLVSEIKPAQPPSTAGASST